jgi:hypothetical protein
MTRPRFHFIFLLLLFSTTASPQASIFKSSFEFSELIPVNDAPAGALDLSVGGTFVVDVVAANNDQDYVGVSCGSTGGRDVFYELTLPEEEVVYFDTFGSNFDTTLRVFAGTCDSLGAWQACYDDQCSVNQSQGARSLAAGTYCLVADQYSGAEPNGSLVLQVTRGGRTGSALTTSPIIGNSCSGTNATTPSCSTSTAEDRGYFFTMCPSQVKSLSANTCTGTAFDSVLYVRRPGGADMACNDDSFACGSLSSQSSFSSAIVVGPGLFWLTVDGYQSQCGAFSLSYTLN